MRTISAILFALAAFAAPARTLTVVAYKPVLPPYVTNGLVHCWDAEYNLGLGRHSDGRPTWKDLVGSVDLQPRGTGCWFTAHALYCPSRSYYDPTRPDGVYVGTKLGAEAVTVEVAVDYGQNRIAPVARPSGYSIAFSDGADEAYYGGFGDQYSSAGHFIGLAKNDSNAYYGIANKALGIPTQVTYWNVARNGIASTGADFQSAIEGLLTYSGSNTNRADVGRSTYYAFPYVDVYAAFHAPGASGPVSDLPNPTWRVRCGLTGGEAYPRFVSNQPVGTGLSVAGTVQGGVQYNLFTGWIYCIRVYNRYLTREEREANALVDRDRFRNRKETM